MLFKLQKVEYVPEEEIRVVVVGRTGSGKSSLGNQILMENKFKTALLPISVTGKAKLEWTKRVDMKISVVDTPGFFHTGLSDDNVRKQIFKSLQLTSPGLHAFLYTFKIGRYSDEELKSFFRFIDIFGEAVFNNIILVFTGKDYLKENDINLYVEMLPDDFKEIAKKCQGRIIAFNNLASQSEQQQQWNQLQVLIKAMTSEKNYKIFSADMVQQTSSVLSDMWKTTYKYGKSFKDLFFEK